MDDYILRHLCYHLFHAEEYAELYEVIETGFLDQKLARFGDPGALVEDYDYAFRACERTEHVSRAVLLGLRRTLLSSQAQMLKRDLEEPVAALAHEEQYRHWLRWCVGLCELLPEPAERVSVLSKLSACADESDRQRILRLVRGYAKMVRLDTFSSISLGGAMSRLAGLGPSACSIVLTEFLPLFDGSSPFRRHHRSDALRAVAEAAGVAAVADARPLLQQLRAAIAAEDAVANHAASLALARAYLAHSDGAAAVEVLEDLLGRCPADSGEGWRARIDAARLVLEIGSAAAPSRCARALAAILRDIRDQRTPFDSWEPLLQIARLRVQLGSDRHEIVEAFNEALIAAYRRHDGSLADGMSFMHPVPSSRVKALCAIAEAAFDVGQTLIGERVLEQAEKRAEENSRVGQRFTELCSVGELAWRIERPERAASLLGRAVSFLADVRDINEMLRPGLEKDEAIKHVISTCARLVELREVPAIVEQVLAHVAAVEYRANRFQFFESLTFVAYSLPDQAAASRLLKVIVPQRRAAALPEEESGVVAKLAQETASANEGAKRRLLPRLLEELARVDATTFASLAPRLVAIYTSAGEASRAEEVVLRLSELTQKEPGAQRRHLLVATAQVAATTKHFATCEGAIRLLFDSPILPDEAESVAIARLAARAYGCAGNNAAGAQWLRHAERFLGGITVDATRAEAQARVGREWHALGMHAQAGQSVRAALESMRRSGSRTYGNNPYAAIAEVCGLLGDGEGPQLLIDAVNTARWTDLERTLRDFVSACEHFRDTQLALHVLDSLEAIAQKTINHRVGADYRPGYLLPPIRASRAAVLYRVGDREAAAAALTGAIKTAEALLDSGALSVETREPFVQMSLAHCCQVCSRLSDRPAARRALADIEAAADRFQTPTDRLNFHQHLLYGAVAEALICLGAADGARVLLERSVGVVSSRAGDGILGSIGLKSLVGLLFVAGGGVNEDLVRRISTPDDLEGSCEELGKHAGRLPSAVVHGIFKAVLRTASAFPSVAFLRIVLRLCELLARHRPARDIEFIVDEVLRRSNLSLVSPAVQSAG